MSVWDDPAERLTKWVERREAGDHDEQCEQRERSYICHCGKRARLASGLTEPPEFWYRSPQCGHCLEDLTHDGDGWVCNRCHTSWPSNASDGERGRFDDDYGTDFGGEQFGALMRDKARGAA